MAELINFPRRKPRPCLPKTSFMVRVMAVDDGWLVVSRSHSWLHVTRAAALKEARSVADGFGAGLLIDMRGAA